MKQKILALPLKQKRRSRTNYRRRLQLLLSEKPRLVIRKTLMHMSIQLIAYDAVKGDKVLLSAHSSELKKKGWTAATGNIPAAYLTGLLFATKAKKLADKKAVVDIGFHVSVYGARIYAALKGVVDGGISLGVDARVFPNEERVTGKHIEQFATKSKQFTKSATNVPAIFKKVKKEVLGE